MSPLRLDRYFLKELHFALNEGFDRGTFEVEDDVAVPDVGVGVVAAAQNPNNILQWRFEVKLELEDDPDGKFPYKVAAIMVGYFTVSDQFPAERAEEMARANAPALLYSGARELLRSVTGRGPYRALLLPSITFVQPRPEELAKRVQKQLPATKDEQSSGSKKAAARKASKVTTKKRASKKKSG